MKKIINIIIALAIITIFQSSSYAIFQPKSTDIINSIDTVAIIQTNGDMKITQTWDTTSSSGTEWFIPLNKLNHMELRDFRVYEVKNGKNVPYTFLADWNTKSGLEAKKNLYSDFYNTKTKSRELVFGKGEYGSKKFVLTWTYKNAVQSYKDNFAGFHINFVNQKMNVPINHASVKVYITNSAGKYYKLNPKNTKIWAFGYEGNINIVDETHILAETVSKIDQKKGFMSILVKLNPELVTPNYISNMTFEEQKNIAFKGSSYFQTIFDKITGFVIVYSIIIIQILLFIFSRYKTRIPIIKRFFVYRNSIKYIKRDGELRKHVIKTSMHDIKSTKYFRDIPLGGNIQMIQGLLELSEFEHFDRSRLINAMILRLQKNNFIKISEGSPYEDVSSVITFTTPFENDEPDSVLSRIFSAYYKNRDVQNRLYFSEVSKRRSPIRKEISNILKYDDLLEALRLLKEEGYIYWNSDWDVTKTVYISDKGEQALKDIYGLYNYINDFTLVGERDFEDLGVWDEYLVMSALFGNGIQFAKILTDINPEYRFADYNYLPEDYVIFSMGFSKFSYYPFNKKKAAIEGLGGAVSLGGGAGASGAGFGGGTR